MEDFSLCLVLYVSVGFSSLWTE